MPKFIPIKLTFLGKYAEFKDYFFPNIFNKTIDKEGPYNDGELTAFTTYLFIYPLIHEDKKKLNYIRSLNKEEQLQILRRILSNSVFVSKENPYTHPATPVFKTKDLNEIVSTKLLEENKTYNYHNTFSDMRDILVKMAYRKLKSYYKRNTYIPEFEELNSKNIFKGAILDSFIKEEFISIVSIKEVFPKVKLDESYVESFAYKQENITSESIDTFKELKDNLARRYAILEKPKGKKNLILDSFLPKLFIKHNFTLHAISRDLYNMATSVTMINRNFASLFGIKALSIEAMINMLNYKKEYIKELLEKVKKKKYCFAFIGVGGVGQNTITWLSELCDMCNVIGLFKKIALFDDDYVSIDNIFRFPGELKTFFETDFNSAVEVLNENTYYLGKEFKKIDIFSKKALFPLSLNTIKTYRGRFVSYELPGNNWILYGAPDIESRKDIIKTFRLYSDKEKIKCFITALHGDNECTLTLNPSYLDAETSMMTESYGIIQLNVFFFNQLKMAITLLETLANEEDLRTPFNKELLNYSCLKDKKFKKTFDLAYQNITTIMTNDQIEQME